MAMQLPQEYGAVSRHRRGGFTLIELLVTIAIVAILMSLLLPAVQQSREAARRTDCKNHLREIGLALHNYYQAHETYPPGSVHWRRPIRNLPAGYHHGWIVSLLPYLDQGVVARQIDPQLSIYDPKQLRARQVQLPILLCGSDPASRISNRSTGDVALSNYAGCHHHKKGPIDTTNHGVMFLNSRITIDDVVDGLSHTMVVGELKRDPGDLGWASGTRATLRNTGTAINGTPGGSPYSNLPLSADEAAEREAAQQREAGAEPPDDRSYNEDGTQFSEDSAAMGGAPLETDSAAARPPSVPVPQGTILDPGGFGSHHAGGAHFLLCDGQVRFISENVTQEVYERLADRADRKLPLQAY